MYLSNKYLYIYDSISEYLRYNAAMHCNAMSKSQGKHRETMTYPQYHDSLRLSEPWPVPVVHVQARSGRLQTIRERDT